MCLVKTITYALSTELMAIGSSQAPPNSCVGLRLILDEADPRTSASNSQNEDIYFQLRCDCCVAEDDVGKLRIVLNEVQRNRIQIGFVPETVAVAQAFELIF